MSQETATAGEPGENPGDGLESPNRLALRAQVASLPELPGVYRYFDEAGTLLYVGKAKNLKRRVSSYFQRNLASPRTRLMVARIHRLETTVTRSEAEALLLENNLIKRLSPRYNILFRDDKSYPYIVLTRGDYPRLGFHRGGLDRRADYFGPFPSAQAVRASVHLLQKMFRLRTCEESVFANRTRPCLLYQIRRCSGPCVQLITPEDYREDVRLASLFLLGRQQEVIARLTEVMENASRELAFERAAQYRDQIQALAKVQDRQFVESQRDEDADVAVVVEEGGVLCVNLAMIRGGRHLGDKPLFPSNTLNAEEISLDEVLAAFLAQHYGEHPIPHRILVNRPVEEELGHILGTVAGHPVLLSEPRQGAHRVWVEMAVQNAGLAISSRRQTMERQGQRLALLGELLGLEGVARIECFDISHTQGEATVASCVVYQDSGMKKSDYRRFNIHDITKGDDYAAMAQVVTRRYEKLAKGEEGGEGGGDGGSDGGGTPAPDLILIDGGKGQVMCAKQALDELGLGHLPVIGVAKGLGRKPGLESLVFPDDREPLQWPPDSPALHLIQEIRDEAHRFAITGHRAKRGKARRTSTLEEIPGIGPRKRKALITRFGGLQGITAASIEQLTLVPGISHELAERIYQALH